jgi:dTDP-4-amino-4,6-dideoxygalactose transaminase
VIISARPYPNISALFSKSGYSDLIHVEFHFLGREALLSSLIKSGVQRGDGIIIPAYMCDSTIKPLKTYGFNLVFIDIEKDLNLSVDRLKKAIDGNQIKALLLVHYFGLTQNIDEVVGVCREYDIKVVEDASHNFISQFLRNKNSIKGDIEVFSMRKSLPIVDGGALRINHDSYDKAKNSTPQCVSITSDLKYLILRFLEKIVTALGINIYGQSINNIKTKLRSKNSNDTYDFNVKPCQASWQLKKYLGNEEYLQDVQQIIVNNFNQLSQALQILGFRLLVESVEQNVVPQACVVYDDKGGLVDYLRSKGIGAWRWPGEEMPEEVAQNSDMYPNAVFFDEKLVLIPIHQSLGDKQINYIIQVLSRWQL